MTDDNASAPRSTMPASDDVAPTHPPGDLGLQLRFDAGRAVLALDGRRLVRGGEVRRSLFEVPVGPQRVDVGAGPLAYVNEPLALRAIELVVPFDSSAAATSLRSVGIQVLRDRPRAAGLDLLLQVAADDDSTAAPSTVRVHLAIAPVDDGVVLFIDEILGLPAVPRGRLELAETLLAAFTLAGAATPRACLRRASPIAPIVTNLLQQHGWKAPTFDGLLVRDLSFARGELVVRAWSGALPEGWRPAREPRRAGADVLVTLQAFADSVTVPTDAGRAARRASCERLARDGAIAPAVLPYVVDVLAREGAAASTLDKLVRAALDREPDHLALLGLAAELPALSPAERAARLQRLAVAADGEDDPWVAARAGIAAAVGAEASGDLAAAVNAAAAAVDADPTLAEAGRLLARLLARAGDRVRALEVGRAAIERAGQGSIVDSAADLDAADAFAVELAPVAREVEGIDAARALLLRALHVRERGDALLALASLETESGRLHDAEVVISRLDALEPAGAERRVDVALLSARIAELRGEPATARARLEAAHASMPDDPRIAARLARLRDAAGEPDAAIVALAGVVDAWLAADAAAASDDLRAAARLAAQLLVGRAQRTPPPASSKDDAVRARRILARLLMAAPDDPGAKRLDAEARAALGDGKALALLLLVDADAADHPSTNAVLRVRAARLLAAAGDGVAAVDAWTQAWDLVGRETAREVVDVDLWLTTARGIADPRRLGALLARTGVGGLDLSSVVTSFLRATIAAVDDADARRGLLGVIAARNAELADVERWLEACRDLPDDQAAEAFHTAARSSRRVDWLLEAVDRLERHGHGARALAIVEDALGSDDVFARDARLIARAFALAVSVDDADAIDARAVALRAATIDDDALRRSFAEQHAAHARTLADPERARRALAVLRAWTDAFPAELPAVGALVGNLLEGGNVDDAVVVLDRACAAGAGPSLHLLLSRAAAAARDIGGPVEVRANELLLGLELERDARDRIERRLVDVYLREGRTARAIALLSTMAGREDAGAMLRATLWLRLAAIHEDARDTTELVHALEQAVRFAPDDESTSDRLRAACVEARDDHALARECLRRAARLPASPARSALLVSAGDVARSAARIDDARSLWLRAARRPFDAVAYERLLGLAREIGSPRLDVRCRLAAAQALKDVDPAAAVALAGDAAAFLAESVGRRGLAAVVLAFCERFTLERGLDDEPFVRRAASLARARGDGAGARRRLDVLIVRTSGPARARLLEERADVAAQLLGDDDTALADRRGALALDPTSQSATAALAAQLRARGEPRTALDVERAYADAALAGDERARAYGNLAATAERELGAEAAAVVDELATVSLGLREDADVRRLQLAARERLGDDARTAEAVDALLRHPLGANERVSLALRLATINERAGAVGRAAETLLAVEGDTACVDVEGRDALTARLVGLLRACGRQVDAADVVLRALQRWPDGTPALGLRAQLLTQAATWLDDAGPARAADALALLGQIASLAPLDDDGELRRARLAESQERPDIAIVALEHLIARNVDVAGCSVRLAAAAEAWGEPERALRAWQMRVDCVNDDEDAWLAVERLGAATEDAAALRRAREVLVARRVGTAAEQAARALACARDARARQGDPALALQWLAQARALHATGEIRRESLAVAVAAGDDGAERSVLDEMVAAGDPLTAGERIRRAALRLTHDRSAVAAQVALGDALAALESTNADDTQAIDHAALRAALATIGARAPAALAAAVVLRRAPLLQAALSAALATIDTSAIGDDVAFALADTFVSDAAFVRLAAARDAAAGKPEWAADRLLALAVRLEEQAGDQSGDGQAAPNFDSGAAVARGLVDEAAAHAIAAGAQALLARLDALRPALRRHRDLCDGALAALQAIGAKEAATAVLDDAIVVEDDRTERRALRLRLVDLLQTQPTNAEALSQAVVHLQGLIDERSDDGDAWSALFACLEALGDRDALQDALARRAKHVSSNDRRDLVVRRIEVLLTLGRGVEGLADLRMLRLAAEDPSLRALEFRVHLAIDADDPDPVYLRGGPAVARFLDDELARAASVEDARALLALPAGAAAPGARIRAQVALLALLDDDDDARAAAILGTGTDDRERADDAVSFIEAAVRHGDVRVHRRAIGVARAIVARSGVLGSRGALRLADCMRALDDALLASLGEDVLGVLNVRTFARRWRLQGPRATGDDVARCPAGAADRLAFRRAARLADRPGLARAAMALGAHAAAAIEHAGAAAARAVLTARATEQLQASAAGPPGDLALLRHGDLRGVGRARTRDVESRRRIARTATRSLVTAKRFEVRLALARELAPPVEDALAELLRVGAVAHEQKKPALQARVLDEQFSLRPPTPREAVQRADAAIAAGADDAIDWCERAADLAAADADLDDESARLRRRAIDARLRRGEFAQLALQLRAHARSAPPGSAGEARRSEALSIAEAARLIEVVDAIMGDAVSASDSPEDRLAIIRRRASLRIGARQPVEAIRVLVDGARQDAELARALRDEAYAIAAANALIDEMIEVVDDDLALAGLLAVTGRRQEAVALAEQLTTPAALWLQADCARRAGDAAAEEAALATVAARGFADDALVTRLVDAAGARGDHDGAARRALGLVSGNVVDPDRVHAAVVAWRGTTTLVRAEGLRELLSLAVTAQDRGVDPVGTEALFAGAMALADDLEAAGFAGARREAHFALARHKDTDDGWADFVASGFGGPTEQLAQVLATMWRRPAVVHAVLARADAARHAESLARVVHDAVVSADSATAVDAIASAPELPWQVAEVVAETLEQTGRVRDAADVLARAIPPPEARHADERRALRARACALLLRADAGGAAARLLQQTARDDLDDATLRQVSDVIVAAARDGAMGDAALLAAHVSKLTGEDRFAVRAIGMADAAGGDVALHVGGWRLRERDVRALPLLAHHCLEQSEAQGFFGAWHALRSGVRQFVEHAPAGFSTIAQMAEAPSLLPAGPSSLSPDRTLLARARVNRRARRAEAWLALAAGVAAVDPAACARLLGRAAIPVRHAPLEVRLRLDPELRVPSERAAAIVSELAKVPVERRPAVVAAFDELSTRGATSATQRRAVDALASRSRAFVEIATDAAAVGEAVDVLALVRALGRRPAPAARTATAALLASLGHEQLAAAVAPSVTSPSPTTGPRGVRSRADDDVDDAVRLGRLLLAQLGGPRIDVEEEICALAEKLGRPWLLVQSLHRLACIAPTAEERARHLVRRATLLAPRSAAAAWRSAIAAQRLHPEEASARLLASLADRAGDPRRSEEALGAWSRSAASADDRVDAAVRRARIVADTFGDPGRAAAIVDEAAQRTPRLALFQALAHLQRDALADPLAAASTLVAAAERAEDVDGATRIALLRQGADVLAAADAPDVIERAVVALCAAHEAGDGAALGVAEALARHHALPLGLARVLDLRLRDTEDVSARRELVLQRARLLHDMDDKMGALALLEAQAAADAIDLGARLTLASWYQADRRVLDAALSYESAARIPGLPATSAGPAAREAAVLFAAAGDLDRAGALADFAVAAGVEDLQVVTVAEAWHRSRENWIAVDELLGRELTFLDDPRRQAHVWMERAEVRRERTHDDAGARKALGRVLEIIPDHPRALQMAREDAQRSDTWGALRAALLRAAETSTDAHTRAVHLTEMAAIDADRLGDLRAALALLDRALDLVPDDTAALSRKAILMVRAGHVDGVAGLIERIERIGGDISRLPGQLHLVRGDALVVVGDTVHARLAFLRATDDPETSAKAWDRLIDMASGSADALPLLEQARRSSLDAGRQLGLSHQELRLRMKLGDEQGAFELAREILQRDPGSSDALDVIRPAMLQAGDNAGLAVLLVAWAKAIDAQTAPSERASRLAHAGAFLLADPRQEPAARALFDEALALAPEEPRALLHLADIAWANRDDERGLQLLDRLTPDAWVLAVDEAGAPRELADLYYRRARCAYALGHDDVRERLRLVLRQDARHVRALEMLSRVAAEHGDDDNSEFALEALSQAISRREDPERLVNVLVDLAQLRLRRGKHAEAVSAAEGAFALAPESLAVLEVLADAREDAGRKAEVADTWLRIAALKTGAERRRALERRARALTDADRVVAAFDAWMELFGESSDPRHRAEAEALTPRVGAAQQDALQDALNGLPAAHDDAAEGERTESMVRAPGAAGDALEIQLRANLDDGDAERALALAVAAGVATLDDGCAQLALDAAQQTNRFDLYVDIVEAQLTRPREPAAIRALALAGGRVARDVLRDNERAAVLLYQAHQADAEDVDVRLELTAVYARIARLASHAVTGVVQLLRRTPDDVRVFALAGFLGDQLGQPDRAAAMRAVAATLTGQATAAEVAVRPDAPTNAITPLDRESIASRIGPTGWNAPLQAALGIVAPLLEVAFEQRPDVPGMKPLAYASPRSLALAERADRLLPGRVAQLAVADVDRSFVLAGATPVVVLPRDLLAHEAALLAAIARGLAVIRWNATIVEQGLDTTRLVDLLRIVLLENGGTDERTTFVANSLRDEDREAARALLLRALEGPELPDTARILTRACDRFALVATGAPLATLTAGPLPQLLREAPSRHAELLRTSARGLDLVSFAARDNVWALRRAHGL